MCRYIELLSGLLMLLLLLQVLLMLFTVFYAVVFVSGLLGNLSVIVVVVRSKVSCDWSM